MNGPRLNNVKVVYWFIFERLMIHFNHLKFVLNLGEEVCKLYKKTYDLNVEICRFYNVYGPDEIIEGDWAKNAIGIWRRQVRDGEKITIVGDGEQRRDFTHVVDIVDGLYKVGMVEQKHEDAGTWNWYKLFNKRNVWNV